MKKPYSLDYSIERDTDRLKAVEDILDKLEKNPSPTELEQMGSYILYGKDENGKNAYQRGEMIRDARYNSYKTKDDQLASLDEILENPLSDQQQFKDLTTRDPYIQPRTTIKRPKYDKQGDLIDIGDGDIPGMRELWECIDRNDHWIAVLEGKAVARGDEMLFENPYRLYRLRHALIDMRRHQYYLKDSYKPCIHFLAADHPKRQFIDWNSDSYYWISREEWERRINTTYFPISKKIEDYETKNEGKEVKWVVRRHTFDWENLQHVRALIGLIEDLRDKYWDKINTDIHSIILDFDRYRRMCAFSPSRECMIKARGLHYSCGEIRQILQVRFGLVYTENHISSILYEEIPNQFARVARRNRLLIETPNSERQRCKTCGKLLPKDVLFFSINRNRKIGFCSRCKDCEKQKRINKGAQPEYDRRKKEAYMYQMQTGETRN